MDPKKNSTLRNQSGAALVIALIMIVVLTLIGLASSYTSIFEIKLSGNKRGSTDAFYAADGGAQSVLANLTNFRADIGYIELTDAEKAALPVDLKNESINSRLSSPALPLPAGVNFAAPPQVTIYHTTRTDALKGKGYSADPDKYGSVHFVVDSIGKDQTDTSLFRSSCQVRTNVVRLVPTE